ncbi:MAG: ATP-dependent sacrificial sulfur transferase LarE [Candidatus Thorarchaeota archaeon]|jgi:uncharacterized protein
MLESTQKKFQQVSDGLTVHSPTIAEEERVTAKDIAEELDLPHHTMTYDWVGDHELNHNPTERCYVCKKKLASKWKETAASLGLDIVVEGSHASDLEGYRPGEAALKEEGINSPFLDANITKEEIREYARENCLSVADRPSMACLATRFPYGTEITADLLKMIEHLEKGIREIFGVRTLRARYHGSIVRIEVGPSERELLFDTEKLDRLHELGKSLGIDYLAFDVQGYRTGSMDESN